MSATSIHNNWIRFMKRQLRSIPFSNILIKVNWGVFQLDWQNYCCVILPKKYHPLGWGAPDVEVTTQQTDNLLRFFKKSTTSHAIQQRSCPSSFEVNVQKMARVRIELKFWWKFSQIIIIFWGQFLPPAVYLSALFEVILTWRWSCWVVAPFNKKPLRAYTCM